MGQACPKSQLWGVQVAAESRRPRKVAKMLQRISEAGAVAVALPCAMRKTPSLRWACIGPRNVVWTCRNGNSSSALHANFPNVSAV
jgi:hypothetical protein